MGLPGERKDAESVRKMKSRNKGKKKKRLEKNERKGLCVSDREKIMLVWAVLHLDSWHILPLLC